MSTENLDVPRCNGGQETPSKGNDKKKCYHWITIDNTKYVVALILNLCFYIVIFMIVKDVFFSLARITIPELNKIGIVNHLWSKVSFTSKPWHHVYAFVLAIGLWNIFIYQFQTIKNFTKPYLKLKFNVKWLSSPTCTSTLHFLVFAVGIYFSVISSAINNWIAEDILMSSGTSYSFSIVVAVFMLSIIVFVLNQIAINKKKTADDKAHHDVYEDKLLQLENIIRLAPPNDFSEVLSNYVDVADDFRQTVSEHAKLTIESRTYMREILKFNIPANEGIRAFDTVAKKDVVVKNIKDIEKHIIALEVQQESNAKYIRALLIAYARLAALFDGVNPSQANNNIFRANLMLKYSNVDKSLPEANTIRYVPSVLKGHESNTITRYLTLNEEHSVSVYTEKLAITKKNETNGQYEPIEFNPDSDIKTFSIPYFLGNEKKKYNCFGAPRAIANAECQFINNTADEIIKWASDLQPPEELIDEAEQHFLSKDRAKSIISIPLLKSRYSAEHKESKNVMGVVNIYRDKTNLMMGDELKQKQFEYITTPLNYNLARIVSQDIISRYHANLLKELKGFATIDVLDEQCIQTEEIGKTDG